MKIKSLIDIQTHKCGEISLKYETRSKLGGDVTGDKAVKSRESFTICSLQIYRRFVSCSSLIRRRNFVRVVNACFYEKKLVSCRNKFRKISNFLNLLR